MQVNDFLPYGLLIVCGSFILITVIWKAIHDCIRFFRTVLCINDPNQRWFAKPSIYLGLLKRHLIYAPILKRRHAQGIQLSSITKTGSFPTRLQLFLMVTYLAMNVALTTIQTHSNGPYKEFVVLIRHRLGILATLNMIPLFILASRNNILVQLLGIPFDTHILLHRWLGRIVAVEALGHTIAHLAGYHFTKESLTLMVSPSKPLLFWGFVGSLLFLLICIQASSPLRHAFYETFRLLHICLVVLSVYALWRHLKLGDLPELTYVYAIIAVWVADHLLRAIRLVLFIVGRSVTDTSIAALAGDVCRVTVTLSPGWQIQPGQHVHLYLPLIGLLQSHPFSIAWATKVGPSTHDTEENIAQKQQISFIIRARTGMTETLYRKAASAPNRKLTTTCFLEGPYGSGPSLASYGTVILLAGGVGITQQLLYVKSLLAGYSKGTVATRRILLVWSTRHPEHLEWIEPWISEISAMNERNQILQVMLFISKPIARSDRLPSNSIVEVFRGRPDIDTMIAIEQERQIGAMVVSTCDPGELGDTIRYIVRKLQGRSTINLVEDAYSW